MGTVHARKSVYISRQEMYPQKYCAFIKTLANGDTYLHFKLKYYIPYLSLEENIGQAHKGEHSTGHLTRTPPGARAGPRGQSPTPAPGLCAGCPLAVSPRRPAPGQSSRPRPGPNPGRETFRVLQPLQGQGCASLSGGRPSVL